MDYLKQIKKWLEEADAIVINTGAGMGVDSGLSDYRGENNGQWGAVESETGESVFDVVNPQRFSENPSYGWELFAKRLKAFNDAEPHKGFYILKQWIERFELEYFILTSNIDGHFQRAGFDEGKIRELHGSLAYFQSANPELSTEVWKHSYQGDDLMKDAQNKQFPLCPVSQTEARPNVYMFRDNTYINTLSKQQDSNFQAFLNKLEGENIIVFEIGSGPHVQSIRMKTRMLKTKYGANIIRINPKDFKIKSPHIGIAKGALEALTEIEQFLLKH